MSGFGVPAFSIGNPWMLAGLLLALVPLLIHLFYRRRYQEVSWAAVLFLGSAVRRNAQRHRLQQIVLLLLRTLALVLLVFAFARPLLDSSLATPGTARRTHRLIVLDTSLSMRCRAEQGTRFDRAVEAVRRLVDSSSAGDSWQLMLVGGRAPEPLIAQPTSDRDAVLRALEGVHCTASRGAQGDAWPVVHRLLDDCPGGVTARQVYLFTDLQAHEWPVSPPQTQAAALRAVSDEAEIVLVDVKNGFAPNMSVSRTRFDQPFVTSDQPVTVRATVRNIDSRAISDRAVRLIVDDHVVASKSVSVGPFSRQTVSFEYVPAAAGHYRVAIECDADRLTEDNRSRRVLRVFDEVPILVVNGKPSARRMGNASDFLQLSLDPGRDSGWRTPYRVRVVSEVEFASARLEDFAAVFACNVRQFTADEAARIRQYVYGGGGFVLCLGDHVDLQNYNSRLLGQTGLLPVRLESVVGEAGNPKDAWNFDATRLEHPLMAAYRGNPGHGLENDLTFQYVRARLADSVTARAALQFTNGDPVVIEGAFGSGTTCLVTVAGDSSRWSTWNTTSGTYVSLVNEIAELVISGRPDQFSATAGTMWSAPVGSAVAVTASTADGVELSVRSEENEAGTLAVIDDVPEPGFFVVAAGDRDRLIAANVDSAESDLRGAAEAILRENWLPEADFRIEAFSEFRPGAVAASTQTGHEASLALFVLVLALLLAEQLLASRVALSEWILFLVVGVVLAALLLLPAEQALTVASIVGFTGIVLLFERRRRRSSAS